MVTCPICGLAERCRNHWVATQEGGGEIEFQVGAMTASEDNLVLLRNKLQNPPLRDLFDKLQLPTHWVEQEGKTVAYLQWPLELRGAVHRTLFPPGAPGTDRPITPTPVYEQKLGDLRLEDVSIDLVNCMPDELMYKVRLAVDVEGVGTVPFTYLQVIWADGLTWERILPDAESQAKAASVIRLMMEGLMDSVRERFASRAAELLADEQPESLKAGEPVDEVVVLEPTEAHLGEWLEELINERRLQPLMRDTLIAMGSGVWAQPVARVN